MKTLWIVSLTVCVAVPLSGDDVSSRAGIVVVDQGASRSSGSDSLTHQDVAELPSVRNRDPLPVDGWAALKRKIEFPPGDKQVLAIHVRCAVDHLGRAHAPVRISHGVGEQERFKEAILAAGFHPALRDFEPADGELNWTIYVRRSETEEAQPGATDNPGDAQRLREDH